MKRGNFKIDECGTRDVPWFHGKTRSFLFFSPRRNQKFSEFSYPPPFDGRRKIGNEATGGSRVYSSCTRVWSHQRVYAERVSIRDFTGSKAPSGSIVIPLCRLSLSLSLLWGATKKTKEEDETKPLYGWPFPPVMGNVEAAQRHAAKIYSAPRASAYRSRSTSVRSLNFVLSTRSGMKSREAFFTNRSKREI